MKVLLLSRYTSLAASSRYRSYQYLPYLKQQGFEITISPLLDDRYIKSLYTGEPRSLSYIIKSYSKRLFNLLQSKKYNLIWIEKEALPWVPASLELLLIASKVPYVVDYDDATFHRYDLHKSILVRSILGKKIDKLMAGAKLVIVGNDYLAARAVNVGAKWIEVIPTVINLDLYPINPPLENEIFTIGWIGSPIRSAGYFQEIYPALQQICAGGKARVVAIGAAQLELEGVSLEIKNWCGNTEVAEMQKFDVGIMPLTDTPFERGKCGFKLIQYMGCSVPVIGSPVGVNQKMIRQGVNGFLASNTQEWVNAFEELSSDSEKRKRMGNMGRKIVEKEYSLQVTAPKLASLLSKIAIDSTSEIQ